MRTIQKQKELSNRIKRNKNRKKLEKASRKANRK